MATHILTRKDGKTYYLSLEPRAEELIKQKILKSEPIEVKDDIVQGFGATLTKIITNPDVNTTSNLQLDHEELQALTAPGGVYADLFYKQILDWNFAREKHNKPWVFKKAIEFAKQESGYNTPQDVIEFIEAEWETVKDYNQSSETIDWLGRKQIKDWLMTEKGREYSQTHNR